MSEATLRNARAWPELNSTEVDRQIPKTILTRSDPSGGGEFNRFVQSAGPGPLVMPLG